MRPLTASSCNKVNKLIQLPLLVFWFNLQVMYKKNLTFLLTSKNFIKMAILLSDGYQVKNALILCKTFRG